CRVAVFSPAWPRGLLPAHSRVHHYEDFRNPGQHCHLLSDLLAAPEWKSPSENCTAYCNHNGINVGDPKVRIYSGVAPFEFSGSVWTFCVVGEFDVLGIP